MSKKPNDAGIRGIALRPDLQISHQQRDGKRWVVIQDPLRHQFYEMLEQDYGMALRIRDGATLGEVVEEWRRTLPELCEAREDAELRRHAERLIGTVRRLGLGGAGVPMGVNAGGWGGWAKNVLRRIAGMLFWRVRLFDPDLWLGRRIAAAGRAGYWAAVLGGGVLLSLGVALRDAGEMKLHPEWFGRWDNLVALYVGLFALKVIHEAGHALVCKSLGGRVPEVGMQMVGVHPTFYVDVSETWMWPDRRRRIAVAAAGIGAELVVAAFFFWCWKLLGPGFLKDLSLQLAFTASVLAILFNANPLMRYDGYHILTDLVREPRLRQKSFAYWQRLIRWLVLGGTPWRSENRSLLFGLYGILSVGYLGFVILAVGRMVNRILGPFGLEAVGRFFLAGWILALLIPVAGFATRLLGEIRRLEPVRRRAVVQRLCVVFVAGTAILGVPLPVTVERQGVLEVPVEGWVRAVETGFVREVRVREGDWVQSGQVLVRIENRILQAAKRTADLEVAAARVGLQAAQASQAVADLDAARRHLEEAKTNAAEAGRRVDSLVLVAPLEGRVATRELGRLLGSMVRAGQEVVSVVPSGRAQVLLPLSEPEARRVRDSAVARFRPASEPEKVFEGRVTSAPLRVEGGTLPAVLSVLAGGDIVLDEEGRPVSGEVTHLSRMTFEAGASKLWPGGTGRVRLDCGRLPVGRWVWHRAIEAIDLGHRL